MLILMAFHTQSHERNSLEKFGFVLELLCPFKLKSSGILKSWSLGLVCKSWGEKVADLTMWKTHVDNDSVTFDALKKHHLKSWLYSFASHPGFCECKWNKPLVLLTLPKYCPSPWYFQYSEIQRVLFCRTARFLVDLKVFWELSCFSL